MRRPGPILVYSIYQSDIARFERLLARALPDVSIHCASSPQQATPYLDDAVILYGWGFPPEMPARMRKLRWLQKMGAGVDEIIEHWPFGSNVLLTRTDGKRIAPRMAEYVLGAILDKSVRFDAARAQQARRHWEFFEIGTIRNLTIGIAGLGEIGAMVADTLRPLGARVIGWRRSQRHSSSVDELFAGRDALPRFVGACDVVVLVLPQALLAAIAAKMVGHATLDVFAAEPLPPDHPFWENPHVTITPHICGPLVPEDVVPHFLANYAAFANGRPLQNVIDLERQY
jgi:glyoxylate/hydroxypyruvate reductase A